MESLTITKEKVLEAAAKCATAKEVLKTIFPEAFKEEKEICLSNKINRRELERITHAMISISCLSGTEDKSFYLTNDFNWEFKPHPQVMGGYLLIPTKK